MENSLSLFLDHFSREEIKLGTSSWSDWGYGISDLPQNLILYADAGGGLSPNTEGKEKILSASYFRKCVTNTPASPH